LPSPGPDGGVFKIGSISKSFTAAAVMLLVQDDRLRLDERLATYLRKVPDAWNGITIRHVLTHTAGLWDWDREYSLSYRREWTDDEYIAFIAAHPLDFAPGSRHQYSNAGFPLLGMVIAAVSGQSYERFVEQRLFAALRMSSTRFTSNHSVVPRRADGYEWVEGSGWRRGEPLRPRVIASNGGILSTLSDMALWDSELRHPRVLTAPSLAQMWTPARLTTGGAAPYGFGFYVQRFRNRPVIHHIGETRAGFSSSHQRFPEDDLSVIVLANAAGVVGALEMSREIAAMYFRDRPGR
jgi:CubicO group peptidase (beta-lactamase class C family)